MAEVTPPRMARHAVVHRKDKIALRAAMILPNAEQPCRLHLAARSDSKTHCHRSDTVVIPSAARDPCTTAVKDPSLKAHVNAPTRDDNGSAFWSHFGPLSANRRPERSEGPRGTIRHGRRILSPWLAQGPSLRSGRQGCSALGRIMAARSAIFLFVVRHRMTRHRSGALPAKSYPSRERETRFRLSAHTQGIPNGFRYVCRIGTRL